MNKGLFQMKNIKKVVLIAAVFALTAGLAACGSKTSAKSGADKKEKKEIVIATGAYPKPYAYEEDSKLKGFDIDLARAVFKQLPDYSVKFEKTEFASILSGIDAGRYQMGANSFAKSEEREAKYTFSEALYNNPMGIIIPKDSDIKSFDDLGGKSTSGEPAVSYSVLIDDYNKAHPDNKITLNYTEEDMVKQFQNVESGKIDFKLESIIIANETIKDQGLKLKTIEVPEGTVDSRSAYSYFIFAKNDEGKALAKEVNKALDSLRKDGTISKLSVKYFGKDYVPTAAEAKE